MSGKIKRMIAAMIDFYIACFLAIVVVGIFTWGKFTVTPVSVALYLIFCFLFILIKDLIFGTASIGKRILKLVVIKTDKTKFTIVDALKRNFLLLLLLPIEVLLLIKNNKRIGDIWAKTTIVCCDSDFIS